MTNFQNAANEPKSLQAYIDEKARAIYKKYDAAPPTELNHGLNERISFQNPAESVNLLIMSAVRKRTGLSDEALYEQDGGVELFEEVAKFAKERTSLHKAMSLAEKKPDRRLIDGQVFYPGDKEHTHQIHTAEEKDAVVQDYYGVLARYSNEDIDELTASISQRLIQRGFSQNEVADLFREVDFIEKIARPGIKAKNCQPSDEISTLAAKVFEGPEKARQI